MFKHKINKEKGITLIALVVTIVILLILAMVSISMLAGENGIINKEGDASQPAIGNKYFLVITS